MITDKKIKEYVDEWFERNPINVPKIHFINFLKDFRNDVEIVIKERL